MCKSKRCGNPTSEECSHNDSNWRSSQGRQKPQHKGASRVDIKGDCLGKNQRTSSSEGRTKSSSGHKYWTLKEGFGPWVWSSDKFIYGYGKEAVILERDSEPGIWKVGCTGDQNFDICGTNSASSFRGCSTGNAEAAENTF